MSGHAVSCDKQKYKIGILILTIEKHFNKVRINAFNPVGGNSRNVFVRKSHAYIMYV